MDDNILEIDLNTLDTEWIEQPKLFFKYAKKLADAKTNLDQEKNNLSIVEAELDNDIRAYPKNYDIEKVTEKVVTTLIIQQSKYQDALNDVRTAKHEVDILQAFVNALEQRKSALENAVKLHGQNYFSTPIADNKQSKEELEEAQIKKANSKIKKKKRKKTKI